MPNQILIATIFVYSPNNSEYLSDTSSETASYYSNSLSDDRNNQREKKFYVLPCFTVCFNNLCFFTKIKMNYNIFLFCYFIILLFLFILYLLNFH